MRRNTLARNVARTTMRAILAALCVATLVPLSRAVAQEMDQALINEGSRLRVMAPRMASDWLEGTLVSADDAGLVLYVTKGPRGYKDTEVVINRSSISRVAIPVGERRRTAVGAVIGGVSVGAFGSFRVFADCSGVEADCTAGEQILKIGGATVGGALVGGLIGYFIKGTIWRELPMHRISASAAPLSSGDVGVGLSVRY